MRALMPNRPRREPYFSGTRVLDLTTHCTKSLDFWWYGVLVINKHDCKRMKWNSEVIYDKAEHRLLSNRNHGRVWVFWVTFNPCISRTH